MAGRPSFSLTEYQTLANEKQLDLLSDPPYSVRIKIKWRCQLCGKILRKSYHILKYAKNPCRCRNGMSLSISDYHALADKYGLKYLEAVAPPNIFVPVSWQSGETSFSACYHELGYDQIPLKLRGFLQNP